MEKKLNKFIACPNKANATQVYKHAIAHPFSLCLLSEDEFAIYLRACSLVGAM
jgi:hypothetical protein